MISIDEIKALLVKNKKRLSQEIQQSKELVGLLRKSTHTKLTEKEKEQVKTHLIDVLKTIPAFAVFMLPGGIILLPIVAKLIPDILPSSFREDVD
jgi:hypothetical protein